MEKPHIFEKSEELSLLYVPSPPNRAVRIAFHSVFLWIVMGGVEPLREEGFNQSPGLNLAFAAMTPEKP